MAVAPCSTTGRICLREDSCVRGLGEVDGMALRQPHNLPGSLRRSGYPGDLPVRRGRLVFLQSSVPALGVGVSARAAASVSEPRPPPQRSGAIGARLVPVRARRPARQGRGLKTYSKFSPIAGLSVGSAKTHKASTWKGELQSGSQAKY